MYISPRKKKVMIISGITLVLIIGAIIFLSITKNNSSENSLSKTLRRFTFFQEVNLPENKTDIVEEIKEEPPEIEYHYVILSEVATVEEVLLDNRLSDDLNEGENVTTLFGKSLSEENLPIFLKKEILSKNGEKLTDYFQKIDLINNFTLKNLTEEEFYGNAETFGFQLEKSEKIMVYTITFTEDVPWTYLSGSKIRIFGKDYFITSASKSARYIETLSPPFYEFTIRENEEWIIEGPELKKSTVYLTYVEDGKIKLSIDNDSTILLEEGILHSLDNFKVYIKDVGYSEKEEGYAELVISPKRVVFYDGVLEFNSTIYDDSTPSFDLDSGNNLEKMTLSWEPNEQFYLTQNRKITFPWLKNIEFEQSDLFYDADNDDEIYTFLTLKASSYTTKVSPQPR